MRSLVSLVLLLFATAALAQDRQLQIQPAKASPSGERRIALVIGNSAYKTAPLKNPVNDARAISKALAATGFKVTVIEDASLTTMRRAVRAFGDDLNNGGVGLFYYAGHGMQVRGRNYLIPVNADIEREDEVEDGALDANFVMSKMDSARNALNLIILDACRNNPFARSFRSAAQGLAQMDAPSGTLVAFATAPGSVASDGEGANGLYTKHLLASMARPGLPIEQVFKEVRRGVSRETGDRQIPWESSSLKGDFFFIAPDASTASDAQRAEMQRAVAEAVKREQDKLAAEREAQQAQMQKMIQDMLAKQRAEMEAEMRRQNVSPPKPVAVAPAPVVPAPASPAGADREVIFWESIKGSTNPEDYKAYLAQWPQGTFAALARVRANPPAQQAARPIDQLKPAEAKPAAVAAAPVQMASAAPTSMVGFGIGDARFPKIGDRWTYRYTDVLTRVRREASYEVTAVSKEGILESAQIPGAGASMRAFAADPALMNEMIWDFSPYLLAFGTAKPGVRWRTIVPQKSSIFCTQPGWSCRFEGRVVGADKVTVPAGTYDALKVVVEVITTSPFGGGAGYIELTYWYADEAKRLVKATGRGRGTRMPDYDFELLTYQPAQTPAAPPQAQR